MLRCGTWVLAVVFAFGVVASPALAAKGNKTPEDRFKKMDANSDGKLSKDEFKAKAKDAAKADKAFARLDKNKDDSLTLEEVKNAGAKKKKKDKN
jgi:Ca2+-binding EF-hand superfamily protein